MLYIFSTWTKWILLMICIVYFAVWTWLYVIGFHLLNVVLLQGCAWTLIIMCFNIIYSMIVTKLWPEGHVFLSTSSETTWTWSNLTLQRQHYNLHCWKDKPGQNDDKFWSRNRFLCDQHFDRQCTGAGPVLKSLLLSSEWVLTQLAYILTCLIPDLGLLLINFIMSSSNSK